MIDKSIIQATSSWPFVEARKLIKERQKFFEKKGKITLQTGYGPSGLPHIGTFAEVARTTMMVNAIKQIIDIELDSLYKRIESIGYNITISEKAKGFVAEKGFDQKFGARPLKRAIQKYIEDPLAEDIINSNLKEGDTIKISLNKQETELIIKIAKTKKKKSEQAEKDKLEG